MKKNKVDRAMNLITSFTKAEVKEFVDRIQKEHSVYATLTVPTPKVAEPMMDGYWLKEEADKHSKPEER